MAQQPLTNWQVNVYNNFVKVIPKRLKTLYRIIKCVFFWSGGGGKETFNIPNDRCQDSRISKYS